MTQYLRIRDLGHERTRACLERAVDLKRQLEGAVPMELLGTGGRLGTEEPVLATAPLDVMGHLVTLREAGELDALRVALMNVEPDRLAAWFEAALYFPLELFVCVADDFQADGTGLPLALQAGARIFLTHDARLALDEAQAVCFGEKAPETVEDEDGGCLPREIALERYATPNALLLEADAFHTALILRALSELDQQQKAQKPQAQQAQPQAAQRP